MNFEDYPNYDYDPETNLLILRDDFLFEVDRLDGVISHECEIGTVHKSGLFLVKRGFIWDAGSFIAVDTISMVVSSLWHDAFSRMILEEKLPEPRKLQRISDDQFRDELNKWGRSAFFEKRWRWARWAFVRLYSLTLRKYNK